MTITNVSVNSLSAFSRRAAASWSMKGARFHVWFNVDTLVLDSDRRIYKNPPLGIDRKHPDHFDTRYLRADVQKNQEIIRQVFSEIGSKGLIAAAIAAEEEKERQKQAQHA